MATYNSTLYANKTPSGTGHGPYQVTQHLHAIVATPATLAAADTLNFGYLPVNAVICSVVLKAPTQLDSNGAPTLTFSIGIPGTTGLFKNVITTVGRAAGASVDGGTVLTGTGYLYKNTTGKAVLLIGTVGTGAATPVAGTVEVDVEYYLEDTVGSPA